METENNKYWPRENPYSVPEDYFSELPGKINEKILNRKSTERAFPVILRPVSILGFALILFISFFFFSQNNNSVKTEAEITYQDILSSHYFYDVEEFISSEYTSYFSTLPDSVTTEIDFLINNNIELQTLIEEL